MMEHNKQLDDFFHNVSRFIVFIPIVIVIVVIFFQLAKGSSQQKGFKEYSLTPTKSQSILDSLNNYKKSSPSAKFNLVGPLTCSFDAKSALVNAYVKDKKIFIKMDQKNIVSHYLLNGDCVYIWKNGEYSGEKICGISKQVNIVDGLLASGFIKPDMIFGSLGQVFNLPKVEGSEDILKSAMSTCKNEAVPDSIGFSVPKNILFKNRPIK